MIRSPDDVTTTDTATTGSTHEIRTGSARTAIDLLLVAVLGAVFLRVAVWPTLVHHYPFGVGPDMPVYLWWSRVGAAEGISLVGERPGAPALIPTVASALGVGLVPAVAAVQYALMPARHPGLRGSPPRCWRAPGPRSWAAGTSPTSRSSPLSSRPPPASPAARDGRPSRRRCSLRAAASPTRSSSWWRWRSSSRPRRGRGGTGARRRAPRRTPERTPGVSSPRSAPQWRSCSEGSSRV